MQFSKFHLLSIFPALAASADPLVVEVGEDNALTFSPSTATVAVGDKVTFKFYPPIHSVAQGSFESPCQPLSNDSFFSGGFVTTDSKGNATTFTITVNDTQPIYYYCAFPGHCGQGMVGIINPPYA
jgi:plastocyanin